MEEKSRPVGKVVAIVAAVVIIAGVAAFFLASRRADSPAVSTNAPTTNNTESIGQNNQNDQSQNQSAALTIDEVEKHNSKSDCWTIIGGNVYDLTSFIARHPGGDEIERACGEDATALFETRTDENGDAIGTGTPHSSSAESQLETLKLGPLQN